MTGKKARHVKLVFFLKLQKGLPVFQPSPTMAAALKAIGGGKHPHISLDKLSFIKVSYAAHSHKAANGSSPDFGQAPDSAG